MAWVRLDDHFAQHPKIKMAGPLGLAMQVAALCYCNQYLTDGYLPDAAIPSLLHLDGISMNGWRNELVGGADDATWELIVDDLLIAKLWRKVDGGYRIHDYKDYQPSRKDVLADRENARKRQQNHRSRVTAASQRDNGVTGG